MMGAPLAWAGIFVAAALVMASQPLFGLLGFESCFVLAILAGPASAHLGARRVRRLRAGQTRSEGDAVHARPLGSIVGMWSRYVAEQA